MHKMGPLRPSLKKLYRGRRDTPFNTLLCHLQQESLCPPNY